jgi:hypothetical protein
MVSLGADALRIWINTTEDIVQAAQGSFFLGQMLCQSTCLQSGITERVSGRRRTLQVPFSIVVGRVMERLESAFGKTARTFATGPKLRREGRAPYLHILNWLAMSDEWAVDLRETMKLHKPQQASVGQVVNKGNLERFLEKDEQFSRVLHYTGRNQCSL